MKRMIIEMPTMPVFLFQPFDQPHDVTVSRDGGSVYVGDIGKSTGVYKMNRAADSPVYRK